MQNKTCFLLSYIKYGDSDAVLHCFSKDSGYETFFLKGIYSPKNKKKAYLFPLHQITITLNAKKNASAMPLITKIEGGTLSYDYEDVKTNTILFFVSDFLHQIVREETQYNTIYKEIEVFIEELFNKNYNAYIAFIFLVLKSQGISPLLSSKKYLDPEKGIFNDKQSHHLFDEEISTIWKNYLESENPYHLKLSRQGRNKVLESQLLYYQIHFTGFYQPKSLAIIEQLFS